MSSRSKNIIMWALYGALFLVLMVVQTVTFGRFRLLGSKLSMIPVVLACVTMQVGSERGAWYGMGCGILWCLSGADLGGVCILLCTACGVLCGYLCDRILNRNLLSAAMMCLLSLLLVQGILLLLKLYLGQTGTEGFAVLGAQLLLSLLTCPPIYWAAWRIRKAGAPQ